MTWNDRAIIIALLLAGCPGRLGPEGEAGSEGLTETGESTQTSTETDESTDTGAPIEAWCCHCVGAPTHGDTWVCGSICLPKPIDAVQCPYSEPARGCSGETFETESFGDAPLCPLGPVTEWNGYPSCPMTCVVAR